MNDKTAGLTRFNGERKHWKTWKKQRNGYKIINEEEFEGYDGILVIVRLYVILFE